MYKVLDIVHIGMNNDWIKADLFKDFIKQNCFVNGVVNFKEFGLKEYPIQEEAYALVNKHYKNCDGEYYWAGEKYETFEDIFNALNEQKRIIEMIVDF